MPGFLTMLGSLSAYVAAGAAALHPSMARLADRIPDPSPRLTRARLLVLGGAALAVPLSLTVQTVLVDPFLLGPALAGTALLFALVLWRLALLVTALDRSAARHRFMRHAGAALVGAAGDDVADIAVRTLQQLLGDDRRRVSLALAPAATDEDAPPTVRAAAGADADRAAGTPLALTRLPAPARAALAAGEHVAATASAPLDLTAPPTAPVAVLCLPLRAGPGLRGIVTITGDAPLDEPTEDALLEYTAALSLALERAVLEADVARRRGERRFATLVQHASDAVLIVDPVDARVRYSSPATAALVGLEADAVTGRPLTVVLPADDARALLSPGASGTLQSLQLLTTAGQLRDVEVLVDDLSADPDVGGVVLTLRDVTERAELERQLRQRAFHDDLTGLANRSLFLDRLEHALERREPGCAVLFCDLDDFKAVNDGLGHAAGDLVLVETARRLQRCVRTGDTVGRVGGDEFAILVEDGDEATAAGLAERIVAAVAEPLRIRDKEVVMSVSVGVAVSDGRNADTLLRDADTAMYAAKGRGRHHVAVFDPRRETTADRLALAHELRHALRDGGLLLHYQPIVALDDGAVVGLEALVRWQHPTRGLLGPGTFLGVAERAGLVPDVGRAVLAGACREARRWPAHDGRPLDLHVNVSPFQLREGALVADVLSALDHSALPAQNLVLELTEEALVDGRPEILQRLEVLRERGVRIAIDDFGTGYSSLGYLQRLPIDAVKIDRTFVLALDDPTGASLLAGTLDLLRRLELPAVLEGIETEQQLAAARAAGCSLGQGFLLGRPADAAAVLTSLAGAPPGGVSAGAPPGGVSPERPSRDLR